MARQEPRPKLDPTARAIYELYVRFSENLHNTWANHQVQKEIIDVLRERCAEAEYSKSVRFTKSSPVNPERRALVRIRGQNLLGMIQRFSQRELPEALFVNAVGRFEALIGDVAEIAYLENPISFLQIQEPPSALAHPGNLKLLRMLLAGASLADTLRTLANDKAATPNAEGLEKVFRAIDEKVAKCIQDSTSQQEAIERYVEEKLRGIFYGNPVDVFMQNKLRLDPGLLIPAKCAAELSAYPEIVARRNVLVHNLGRIDRKYLREVASPAFSFDDKVGVDGSYLESSFMTLNTLAKTYVNVVAVTVTGKPLPQVRM